MLVNRAYVIFKFNFYLNRVNKVRLGNVAEIFVSLRLASPILFLVACAFHINIMMSMQIYSSKIHPPNKKDVIFVQFSLKI